MCKTQKKRKTIAFVSEFFPPYVTGGAEIFLENLAKYLEGRGFRIIVITSEQGQDLRKVEFKTYKIRSSPFHIDHRYQFHGVTLLWMFANRKLKNKLKKIYEKEKVDVIYINNLIHLSFAPLQAAEEMNVPVVLDVHDYWPICFTKDRFFNENICAGENLVKCAYCVAEKFGFTFLMPILLFGLIVEMKERYKKLKSKIIKKIICHSKNGAKELRKYGLKSIVIPYPYLGQISKYKSKNRKENIFRILFVGRVEKVKGAHLLINIAEGLKEKLNKNLNFRIDVIGKGSLINGVDRPDLNIFVHGYMKEERFKYFKYADCLLALHSSPVPFGIVVLEGMAYQVPIVAIKGTGPAELVKENDVGIVCKKENIVDAIMKLSKNKKLVAKFKINGKKRLKKYSAKKIFHAYESVFNSI